MVQNARLDVFSDGDAERTSEPESAASMRVLMLVRYPRVAASARYRFFDMQDALRARDIESDIRGLMPDDYLAHRFGQTSRLVPGVTRGYWRRIRDLLTSRGYDLLYLQGECLPFLPAALERALLSGCPPYIVDYDDAWFHRYDQHPSSIVRWSLGSKIAKLISGAVAVTVGSEYLRAYAARFNANVHLLPTSINLARYPAAPRARTPGTSFTIGWIGSQGTSVFLREIEEPLRKIAAQRQAKIVVVGAGSDFSLRIAGLQSVTWSEFTEIDHLTSFDVGIMPLTDTPFTRGKCAFKLIQYMGAWKPVVASPVGENVTVVRDRESGFLASSGREWLDALNCLADDAALGRQMGMVGRLRVESGYTISHAADQLAAICESLAGTEPPGVGRRHARGMSL